jgi:hypothetical protein
LISGVIAGTCAASVGDRCRVTGGEVAAIAWTSRIGGELVSIRCDDLEELLRERSSVSTVVGEGIDGTGGFEAPRESISIRAAFADACDELRTWPVAQLALRMPCARMGFCQLAVSWRP